MEHASLSYDGVYQIKVTCEGDVEVKGGRCVCVFLKKRSLTIKLILDDVVENLEQEENQVVVLGGGEEEPGGGESLQEVEQLVGRDHGQALQIG